MFKGKFQTLEKALACLTVFLIPTQLSLHFWPTYSFVFGIRVDYLSPAVYLTDVLILGLVILWYVNGRRTFFSILKKNNAIIFPLLALILLNTIFSTSICVTFWKWLKILEVATFGLYVYNRKLFVGEMTLYKSLFFSAIFFSLIGICQFLLGRTTGLFYIFGERSFSLMTPGIALTMIKGQDFLRAYSTFPHPNALAGFLGAAAILSFGSSGLKSKKWFFPGVVVIVFGMLLTFSLTAFLAGAFVLIILFRSRKKHTLSIMVKTFFWFSILSSLLLTLFSRQQFLLHGFSKNISERIDLSYISGKMISERFLIGEGLNTFIVNIPKFNQVLLSPWLLQPVHNIYLLVFSELGVSGLLLFCWCVYTLIRKYLGDAKHYYLIAFMFILFTGLADHYWLTIQQNLLFLSFFLGFSLAVPESRR